MTSLQRLGAGVAASLTPYLAQQLFGPDRKLRKVQGFIYGPNAQWEPLLSGATTPQTLQIDATHDFMAFSLVGTMRAAAAGKALDANETALVEIQTNSSDIQFTNGPQDFRNVFGTAREPNDLIAPLYLPGGTTVTITLTEIGGADKDVRVGFVGAKIFFN